MSIDEIFCSFLESSRVSILISGVVLHLCEDVRMYLTGVHFNINCVHKYKSHKKDMEGYIKSWSRIQQEAISYNNFMLEINNI